jgi:hypothetical protein
MPEQGPSDIDPLEDNEPRPSTFAERRTIAVLGALAILVAVGLLVRALGGGATPVSAADELRAAPPAKTHAAPPAPAHE